MSTDKLTSHLEKLATLDIEIRQRQERRRDIVTIDKCAAARKQRARWHITGRVIQSWAQAKPDRLKWLDNLLDGAVVTKRERQLFGLKPKSAPEGAQSS